MSGWKLLLVQIAERLGATLSQLVLAWSLRNATSQVRHCTDTALV